MDLPRLAQAFLICPWCRSTLSREAETLRRLGSVAELQPDISPFQVGTRGRWQGRPFELIGRIRRCWDDGQWNEWCLELAGGETGWLAEAQGRLYLSFPLREATLPRIERQKLQAGARLSLLGTDWLVTDLRQVRIVGAQGQLTFNPSREPRLLVDLVGANGGFLNGEAFAGHVDWYRGQMVDFDDLAFTHLRELDGWRF